MTYSKHNSRGSGNQTTWIAIDTNHHIGTVLMGFSLLRRNQESE